MLQVVQISWYVTLFRGDRFAEAIQEIAPVALRYGATEYAVYRSRDDAYRFLQLAAFESKTGFDRYWYGEEFSIWRADYSGWYQVPLVPMWSEMLARGGMGAANGALSPVPAEPS